MGITATINLTPVLVALIICVFLCVMYKMARKDKEKEQNQATVIQLKPGTLQSKTEQRLQEYVEDKVKKGEGTK